MSKFISGLVFGVILSTIVLLGFYAATKSSNSGNDAAEEATENEVNAENEVVSNIPVEKSKLINEIGTFLNRVKPLVSKAIAAGHRDFEKERFEYEEKQYDLDATIQLLLDTANGLEGPFMSGVSFTDALKKDEKRVDDYMQLRGVFLALEKAGAICLLLEQHEKGMLILDCMLKQTEETIVYDSTSSTMKITYLSMSIELCGRLLPGVSDAKTKDFQILLKRLRKEAMFSYNAYLASERIGKIYNMLKDECRENKEIYFNESLSLLYLESLIQSGKNPWDSDLTEEQWKEKLDSISDPLPEDTATEIATFDSQKGLIDSQTALYCIRIKDIDDLMKKFGEANTPVLPEKAIP